MKTTTTAGLTTETQTVLRCYAAMSRAVGAHNGSHLDDAAVLADRIQDATERALAEQEIARCRRMF